MNTVWFAIGTLFGIVVTVVGVITGSALKSSTQKEPK